jgi:hypothetical protein
MSFAPKELQAERELAAAENWRKARRELKAYGAGCLFVAILALCALFYLTGYVAGWTPDCVKPSHVSTP